MFPAIHSLQESPGPFFFFFNNFIFYFRRPWVFIAVLGLSPVVASRGYSLIVHELLVAVAFLVAEHWL